MVIVCRSLLQYDIGSHAIFVSSFSLLGCMYPIYVDIRIDLKMIVLV